jgi:protoporphyrinogen oxidase
LERDANDVGGISRTVSYKGFLFDIGGHRFFSKSREIRDLWDEILPDDFIERSRLSRIYYDGKFYSYPLNSFEALTNLGIMRSAGCVLSYGWARLRPIPKPRTFHQWVRNAFGEKLFSIFFKPYTEKVWGMSCDEISADWAAQRIKGLDLGAAIRNAIASAFGSGGSGTGIKTLIETFRYPRRGPGMMWDAAAGRIRGLGGSVTLGRTVESAFWDPARRLWTVDARTPGGAMETWTADNLVSSAAIAEMAQALRPAPKSRQHASALKYRDFIIVALIVDAKEHFPDNWIYIHDPSVKVGRVQNFATWSPEMVPDTRYICLGMEYFCFEGDGLWAMADADLVALATREIGAIGLIDPASVADACVIRQQKAYPVYDQDYAEHVTQIRHDLETSFPTLHLVGRNGMHKYNNQDHAMMTGILAARNIIAGRRVADPWRVNEDAEYGEAGDDAGVRHALTNERLVPVGVAALNRPPDTDPAQGAGGLADIGQTSAETPVPSITALS